MKTLQKLVDTIEREHAEELAGLHSHNACYRALVRFTGKPITGKRAKDKLVAFYREEMLTSDVLRVSIDIPVTGMFAQYYLTVTNETKGYYFRHFLGYAEDIGAYNPEVFAKRDASHGEAASSRNACRMGLLCSPQLDALAAAIDKHNEAYRVIKSLTEHGSIGYAASSIAGRMLEGTEAYERAEAEAREARRRS